MPLNNFGYVKYVDDKSLCIITRSAQPDEIGFRDLLEKPLNIDRIFKLSNSDEFDLKKEQEFFDPMVVFEHPLPELFRGGCLNDVIKIAQMINNEISLGRNVHIHCSHGRDRTGLVAGAWQLMYGGMSIKEVDAQRQPYGCNAIIELVDSPDRHILTEIYLMKCAGKL